MNEYLHIPKFLLEELIVLAEEHYAENAWKLNTTDRNKHEMREMKRRIDHAKRYLTDDNNVRY